ncbi:MAG: Uma2 family endonuclease [Cyanobacteria bacterium P01_G01_bin.54]
MVYSPPQPLSLAAFLAEPETQPAREYLNGQIVTKPMPQGHHSVIQGELVNVINGVVKPSKVARAFPKLRCSFGNWAIVPDVSVFTWDRVPRADTGRIANVFALAPDWLIEILSPDQSSTKVIKKIISALQNGTQMGWLIDPEEETLFVYRPKQEIAVFELSAVSLPMPAFMGAFTLTTQVLFGWLME